MDLGIVGNFVIYSCPWISRAVVRSELPSSKILIVHLVSFFPLFSSSLFSFWWFFFSFSKRIAENHFVPSQSTFQNVLTGPLMKMLSIIPRTDPMEDPTNDWLHRNKILIFSLAHYISGVFLSLKGDPAMTRKQIRVLNSCCNIVSGLQILIICLNNPKPWEDMQESM